MLMVIRLTSDEIRSMFVMQIKTSLSSCHINNYFPGTIEKGNLISNACFSVDLRRGEGAFPKSREPKSPAVLSVQHRATNGPRSPT